MTMQGQNPGWFPVALSADIAAGTSVGVVLNGAEVVVWRDTSGAAHAWQDRCPHRGMKLSFGFVRGDYIACLYHGWEYDQAGQCRKIPAHPDLQVPTTICTTTYGITETGGMIWVRLAGDAAPPVAGDATGVRSLFVDAALDRVVAGLPFGPVSGSVPLLTSGDLLIGVHPVDAGRTALHLSLTGSPTAQARAAIARQAAACRMALEGAVA